MWRMREHYHVASRWLARALAALLVFTAGVRVAEGAFDEADAAIDCDAEHR